MPAPRGLDILSIAITVLLAIPLHTLIDAIFASQIWRWLLTPVCPDPGLGAWFGGILLLRFLLKNQPGQAQAQPRVPSHREIVTHLFLKLFERIAIVAIAYAVGACFHWIPVSP